MPARVVVTGAQGGLGRQVVAELGAHGYDVVPVDVAPGGPPDLTFDLRDHERVREAVADADLVAHLAANPEPDRDEESGPPRFAENTISTFNVFWAACHAGVRRVAWASSETVYGYPFEDVAPDSFPVREDARLKPQSGYALSKVVGEDLARRLEARFGTTFVALRFSNILHPDPDHPASYVKVPSYQADPMVRVGNLWGYIDVRDAAVATRLALEVDLASSVELTIAAADTIVDTPNDELIARRFPDVPLEAGWGPHRTLLAVDRAREVLGWEPQVSWRDEV